MVGTYTMTLEIGGSCGLPEEARTRRYAASIEERAPGRLVVTLGAAAFLAGPICTAVPNGLGCNQFPASTRDGTVQFDLENHNDDAHGSHIVERLPSGTWVEIIGSASGSIAAESIKATGPASVWYCPVSSSYPFPCSTRRGCEGDLTLSLVRR